MCLEGLMKSSPPPPATSSAPSIDVALLEDDAARRAALAARASEKAMYVTAAEVKGRDALVEAREDADQRIVENCEKAMSKREEALEKRRQHQAREEEAKQAKAEKQAAKEAESVAKKQQKALEKQRQAKRKAEEKAAKAREKERKRYHGGMSWGYDPNAGVAACLPADIQSSRYQCGNRESGSRRTSGTCDSAESGPKYYDRVTGSYYRRSEFDNALGVEVGGPNRTKPPGPLRDNCAQAMVEVDKTSHRKREAA